MNRTEIIFELAKHVHQDHFKGIMRWPTWALEALLDSYKLQEQERAGIIVLGIGVDCPERIKNLMKFNS